jgi:Fe-S cluster biogenesis protein NfuA
VAKIRPTISASRPSDLPAAPTETPTGDLQARVEKIIEMIRPAVQADGGDLEFIDITPDRQVRIRLHGACVGCPSASVTLQLGIERNLREYAPEITGVQAID